MRQALTRLGWFFGLWAMSVLVVGAVALVIRFWLR